MATKKNTPETTKKNTPEADKKIAQEHTTQRGKNRAVGVGPDYVRKIDEGVAPQRDKTTLYYDRATFLAKTLDYLRHYKDCGDVVPQLAGLAANLGISRHTLHRYAKKYQEFNELVDAVRDAQERALINGGLSAEYKDSIVKLMLVQHGYTTQRMEADVDVTTSYDLRLGGREIRDGKLVAIAAATAVADDDEDQD